MTSLRLAIRNTAWNSVIAAIIGGFIALRFFSTNPDFVWWQHLYAFFAASGLSFFVLFLLQSLFSVSASCFSKKAGSFVSFLIISLYFIALVSDTFVYQQYRFHINWAMIDLAINTDGQVISFSTGMIIQIALIVTTLMLLSAICVKICRKISEKKGALWPSLLLTALQTRSGKFLFCQVRSRGEDGKGGYAGGCKLNLRLPEGAASLW